VEVSSGNETHIWTRNAAEFATSNKVDVVFDAISHGISVSWVLCVMCDFVVRHFLYTSMQEVFSTGGLAHEMDNNKDGSSSLLYHILKRRRS
jgi:hypothetical protein